MERRSKFFQFFTAFQMIVNTQMSLQYLKLGAQLQLYETDELEAVYWYIWHLSKELDAWKGCAFCSFSLFCFMWLFSTRTFGRC